MNLREMQEKRSRLVTQAREALEEIRKNTDETRAKELTDRHDTIMADLDKLDADIQREQRVAQFEREEAERTEREARNRRPPFASGQAPGAGGDGEISYRDAFHHYILSGGQEALMDMEYRAALRAGYRKLDEAEQRAMVTGTPAAGGYTVPTELQAELIKTMKMWGPMYDEAITRQLVTTSGAPIPWPTTDDTANGTSATTEGQTLPDDGSGDAVFGQKGLGAYAYATPWLRVSKELADDSVFNMEATLGDLIGERAGRTANRLLTVGTGVNQPNGVANAAGAGKTAAAAAAIAFDDTIDLLHSVDPAYRGSPKCRYMFHDTTLQALRKLKDNQGRYIWSAGDVQKGVPATLNDYQYSINQAMAQIAASAVSMLFGDFNKYIVRKVGNVLIGAIQDKDFWPGFGLAGWHRFDGNLMDTAALKKLTHPAS
jgi:HK97 family phage major capsid protein